MPSPQTYSQKIDAETKQLVKDLSMRYAKCYEANILSILSDYLSSERLSLKLTEKQSRELLRVKSFKEFSKRVLDLLDVSLKHAKNLEALTRIDFELIITNLSLSAFLLANTLNHRNCKSMFNPFTTYLLRSNAMKLHRSFFVLLTKKLISIWRSKFDLELNNLPHFRTDQSYLNFLTDERYSEDSRKSMSQANRVIQTLGYHYSVGNHLIASILSAKLDFTEIKDTISNLEKDLNKCFSVNNRKFAGSFFHKDGIETTQTKTIIDFRRIENILLDIRRSSKKGQSIYASYLLANRIKNYEESYKIEDFIEADSQKPEMMYKKFYDQRLEFLRQYQSETKDLEDDSYLKQEQYNGVSHPARARQPLIKEIAKRLKRGE